MTTLTVPTPDGLALAATTHGDPAAPEILFVHGLGQSRLSWQRQVDALADRFRIVTFDLRGHGASSRPDAPDAYTDGARWAADIQAVIDAAELRRPTAVGWSFGGFAIGHYLKHQGPDRLRGVALTGAVTRMSPELLQPEAIELGPKVTSPDVAERIRGIRETLALTFPTPLDDSDHLQALAFNAMPPTALLNGYGQVTNDGIDEAFAAPSRLWLTYGSKDGIVRPAMAERVLGLNPNATLTVYPTAGHAPFWDEPTRFNRELTEFAG
ncbi:alpha/beta hydrolase [Saccharopolyspora taberi]|uniref:Alpha/beta hydrolase n=1 Tax=Saccharopolyspora taberi TaxID=60895 RepID=A0ABN3VMX6_9PSEU